MYFYSLGPQSFTSGCFFATHYLSTRACSGWQSTFVPNLLSFIWWWSRRDSNPQPSQCHWVTLPIGATVPYRYETKELNLTNGLWSPFSTDYFIPALLEVSLVGCTLVFATGVAPASHFGTLVWIGRVCIFTTQTWQNGEYFIANVSNHLRELPFGYSVPTRMTDASGASRRNHLPQWGHFLLNYAGY